MIATGVASPSAHGQEITRIDIAIPSENSNPPPRMKYHTINEMIDTLMTIGTKTDDILSASFAIGALVALASSTSSIILAIVVSEPTFVALNLKNPLVFVVAA